MMHSNQFEKQAVAARFVHIEPWQPGPPARSSSSPDPGEVETRESFMQKDSREFVGRTPGGR